MVWKFELQPGIATHSPSDAIAHGYQVPLWSMLVYQWQPRDNQDNLLMDTPTFLKLTDSYRQITQNWVPAGVELISYNLINRGFQDGYANNYNGLNFNNYADGYNVVSGTAGSTTITGVGTAFLLYPNSEPGDFQPAVAEGFHPPIQIVDDSNQLQTYFVASITNNTHLTLTKPLINNITSRTYRTLGFILDTVGILDNGSLFSS
jgi:hypothetical protein